MHSTFSRVCKFSDCAEHILYVLEPKQLSILQFQLFLSCIGPPIDTPGFHYCHSRGRCWDDGRAVESGVSPLLGRCPESPGYKKPVKFMSWWFTCLHNIFILYYIILYYTILYYITWWFTCLQNIRSMHCQFQRQCMNNPRTLNIGRPICYVITFHK